MGIGFFVVMLGGLLLELQSVLFQIIPLHEWRPAFVLPMVLFLGLHDSSTTRGAILSFLLGYLWDMFAGSPMGLYTLMAETVYVLSRLVGVRLFLRGALFHVVLTLGVTLVSSGVIVILRIVFGQRIEEVKPLAFMVFPRVLMTAAVAPFIFRMMYRLYLPKIARRREEALGK